MRNGKHVALSTLKEKCLVNSAFWQFTDLYFRIRHTVFTYRDSNISSAEGVSPFFCTSCGWKICACLKIYGNCKHVTIFPQPHVIEIFLSKTFWLYTRFDSNHLRFQWGICIKLTIPAVSSNLRIHLWYSNNLYSNELSKDRRSFLYILKYISSVWLSLIITK